jgi:hypothetical protein
VPAPRKPPTPDKTPQPPWCTNAPTPNHPKQHPHRPPATLVHCGAGVSRSATLAAVYLMRSKSWPAKRAVDAIKAVRSMVLPNDGFWRVMCALEEGLGIPVHDRWD